MATILDTNNVFDYLAQLDYCTLADRQTSQVTVIPAKNFNLKIAFTDGRTLLVKQELYHNQEQTLGEFFAAWRMKQLVKMFPIEEQGISEYLPELLYFDPDNSILIVNFRTDYIDLYEYYTEVGEFPLEIAKEIGVLIAMVHSQTFQRLEYRDFVLDRSPAEVIFNKLDIVDRVSKITPQVFRHLTQECLQFYRLYQRLPNLSQTVIDLRNSIQPSCLVHNDLKINNTLLSTNWVKQDKNIIKLIDWESASWGDPAFDLGCILGSYLELWLDGLVINNTLSIKESLQLATIPLELIQPSLVTLVSTYLDRFPAIINSRPDYLDRVIQFAGLSLIIRLETMIFDKRVFGNGGIIMLQVAKQLICSPKIAINTLFGQDANKLISN